MGAAAPSVLIRAYDALGRRMLEARAGPGGRCTLDALPPGVYTAAIQEIGGPAFASLRFCKAD